MFHFVVLEIASLTWRPWDVPSEAVIGGGGGGIETTETAGTGPLVLCGCGMSLAWIWGLFTWRPAQVPRYLQRTWKHSQECPGQRNVPRQPTSLPLALGAGLHTFGC